MKQSIEYLKTILEEEKVFPDSYNNSELENIFICVKFGKHKICFENKIPIESIRIINKNTQWNIDGIFVFPIGLDESIREIFNIEHELIHSMHYVLHPYTSKILKNPEKYGWPDKIKR